MTLDRGIRSQRRDDGKPSVGLSQRESFLQCGHRFPSVVVVEEIKIATDHTTDTLLEQLTRDEQRQLLGLLQRIS